MEQPLTQVLFFIAAPDRVFQDIPGLESGIFPAIAPFAPGEIHTDQPKEEKSITVVQSRPRLKTVV